MGEMPPTVGSGASSFLHSEHPVSDLMNQTFKNSQLLADEHFKSYNFLMDLMIFSQFLTAEI